MTNNTDEIGYPLGAAVGDLGAFDVSHLEPATDPADGVVVGLMINPDSTGVHKDQLSVQLVGTDGSWQMVDLLSQQLSYFHDGAPLGTTSYADYVTNHSGAVVMFPFIMALNCSGSGVDHVTYVDDFRMTVSGEETVIDFEAPKATLTPTLSATTITAGQTVIPRVRAVNADDSTAIAGESVRLYAKSYPATSYHLVATRTTDANGYASDKLTPLVATTYKWTLPPQDFAPVTSATRSVKVKTRLTAHVSDTTLTRTQNLVLTGSTYKHRRGATVQLRRVTSTGSTLVQSVKVANDGTYKFRHTLPAGKRRVYVHIGSGSGELANNSRTISVTVSS